MKSMSKTVAVMLGVLVLGVSGMPAYALAEEKEPAIVIQEPDGTKAEFPQEVVEELKDKLEVIEGEPEDGTFIEIEWSEDSWEVPVLPEDIIVDYNPEPETDDTEGTEAGENTEEEPIPYDPLTPDGNMNLVDDYGEPTGAGKQFITITTKAGKYFYLIIDRDDNGNETVHFLSQVTELDLLSLMEEAEVELYEEQKKEEEALKESKDKEGTGTDDEETPEEPVKDKEPTKEKPSLVPTFILLGVFAVGGIMFFVFNHKGKNKKSRPATEDPDLDYVDGEEDYLSELPEEEPEEPVEETFEEPTEEEILEEEESEDEE